MICLNLQIHFQHYEKNLEGQKPFYLLLLVPASFLARLGINFLLHFFSQEEFCSQNYSDSWPSYGECFQNLWIRRETLLLFFLLCPALRAVLCA